jgi:hypothetical protein
LDEEDKMVAKYFCDKCGDETDLFYEISITPLFDVETERSRDPDRRLDGGWDSKHVCDGCILGITKVIRW